jgi:CheY-like chemotaxis protein
MATPLGNSDTTLSTTAASAALSRRPCVLLVAEDVQVLRSCAAKLEEGGIAAATARTGFEAIVKACWHLPDVVIMQDGLIADQGVDGSVAAQMIRVCPATAHIPIVDAQSIDGLQASEISTPEFTPLLTQVARELSVR